LNARLRYSETLWQENGYLLGHFVHSTGILRGVSTISARDITANSLLSDIFPSYLTAKSANHEIYATEYQADCVSFPEGNLRAALDRLRGSSPDRGSQRLCGSSPCREWKEDGNFLVFNFLYEADGKINSSAVRQF
jgi:hypothetical protein